MDVGFCIIREAYIMGAKIPRKCNLKVIFTTKEQKIIELHATSTLPIKLYARSNNHKTFSATLKY